MELGPWLSEELERHLSGESSYYSTIFSIKPFYLLISVDCLQWHDGVKTNDLLVFRKAFYPAAAHTLTFVDQTLMMPFWIE